MFTVPNWSVSSSLLKTQTTESLQPVPNGVQSSNLAAAESSLSGRKRKRGSKAKPKDVNSVNLADLWETIIEGKHKEFHKEHDNKKQKIAPQPQKPTPTIPYIHKNRSNNNEATKLEEKNVTAKIIAKNALGTCISKAEGDKDIRELSSQLSVQKAKQEKCSKEKKPGKERKWENKVNMQQLNTSVTNMAASKPPASSTTAPQPTTKLTALQTSMRQKLVSARFRHLNQTLYTTPSNHSMALFQENPEMFTEYHEGFRRQVEVWPENPVNGYIMQVKIRGRIKTLRYGKGAEKDIASSITPLPRTEGCCHIADLGCGDATFSTALQAYLRKLNLKIHSFDLQSPSPLVTKADIANLPLADGSVDVAIFCLALMGTNWVDFIEEAFRILRWKGELWISEIKSRFGRVEKSKYQVVNHSVGKRIKPVDNKKEMKRLEEDENDAIAGVQVDGLEDKGQETDVSAFVEVLRKRGFILKGEGLEAVDTSNKMFVKMRFVKGITPIKGKSVPLPKGMERMGFETWKKPKGKFIDEQHIPSEAGVLKPCVYKQR